METLLQDLRYAIRQLRKAPGFTSTAVITLVLAVCANTTIFSAINTLLFRRLPYADSGRLVAVFNQNLKDRRPNGVSTGDLANWKWQNSVFDQLEASNSFSSKNVMVGPSGSVRVGIQYVTPGLLRLLGVKPVVGRLLLEENATRTDEPSEVVLSYRYWHRQFADDPTIIGKRFFMDTSMVTLVGFCRLGSICGVPEILTYISLCQPKMQTRRI